MIGRRTPRDKSARRLIATFALTLAAVGAGCQHHRGATRQPQPATAAPSKAVVDTLAPSPRLLVGRIIAVDQVQRFAFVELASDAPAAVLADGTDLIVRTLEFRETARVQGSRYVRGRIFGTKIVAGQPSPGDEVVWLAP